MLNERDRGAQARASRARTAALALGLALATACGHDPVVPATCESDALGNPTGEFANTLIRGRPPGAEVAGNTVEAIRQADAAGHRYVEIDVRLTADGRFLPCRHDDLAAFSSCQGRVSESLSADLAGCTTTDGEPAPLQTLDDALADASFAGVYLDLKSTDTEPLSSVDAIHDAMLALLDHVADPSVVVAMSYRTDVARDLLAAGVRVGLKGYPDDPTETLAVLDDAADVGAEMICVNLLTLDAEASCRAATLGLWLLPWAHAMQVDEESLCGLPRPPVGGLISDTTGWVDELVATCL